MADLPDDELDEMSTQELYQLIMDCLGDDDGMCARMPTRYCPDDCATLGHCARFPWAKPR
jgi:hypothetical protein